MSALVLTFLLQKDPLLKAFFQKKEELQTPALELPEDFFSKIHYSWFLPIINSLGEKEAGALISCLSQEQKKGLKQEEACTPLAKEFAKSFFFKSLEFFPFFPKTPLIDLLSLKKKDLVSFISFLGLYDLAAEIPKIVDPTLLSSIEKALPLNQLTFLKGLLKKPPKLFTVPFLEKWDGKGLSRLLQERGLNRLAKALSREHSNFLLYVALLLDTGRGKILLSIGAKKEEASIVDLLQEEILDLLNTKAYL